MSVASIAYHPAVAVFQQDYMARLAPTELSPAFHWDTLVSSVPQAVNTALATLDIALLKSLPDIVIHSGKAMVRDQILSVYRTYHDKASDADPIVVGLSIERRESFVIVRGDIAGEETGRIFFEITSQSCAGNDAMILERVKIAAEELASQSQIAAQAVVNL